jgi:polysaccharide export outer membrane protein
MVLAHSIHRALKLGPGSVISVVCIVVSLFCASVLEAQAPRPISGYDIGPKDLLEIKVFEVPELNVELRVSEEGTIDLPLIGSVHVEGLTQDEVAGTLKTLLESKYVQRASVSVQVMEFRSKPISVIGAVTTPGPLAFSGRWTLLEAITAAGGLAEKHGNVIYVFRTASNGLSDQVEIDLNDLMVGGDSRLNIPLFANDLVNVPAPVAITVFCLGEVERPGALEFMSTERTTVLAAIARAGGLTDRASSKILIKRRDKTGEEVEIEVNYKRIIGGKEPDLELMPNDVVVVKRSLL